MLEAYGAGAQPTAADRTATCSELGISCSAIAARAWRKYLGAQFNRPVNYACFVIEDSDYGRSSLPWFYFLALALTTRPAPLLAVTVPTDLMCALRRSSRNTRFLTR